MRCCVGSDRIPGLVVILLGTLMAASASAQDERWAPLFGPSLVVSAGGVPTAGLGASSGEYGYRAIAFGAAAPVMGGWEWDGGGISGFRLMVHVRFQAESAEVPDRPDVRRLFSMEAGVSAIHVLDRDNQITWSAGAGAAEDRETLSSPKPRLVGRVIALHRRSDRLTLLYGGAYTFVLGKGRLLPVFGILWRPLPGTTVSVIGPVSGRVIHRAGQRLVLSAQASLRGNQYHSVANGSDAYLRVRELRLGGEVGVLLGRSMALFGEAGVATARRLTMALGATELWSDSAGTQPYVSIGLRVSFGTRARWDGLEGFGRD